MRKGDKVSIKHGTIAELQRSGEEVVIPTNAQIRRLVPYLDWWCKAGLLDELIEADE